MKAILWTAMFLCAVSSLHADTPRLSIQEDFVLHDATPALYFAYANGDITEILEKPPRWLPANQAHVPVAPEQHVWMRLVLQNSTGHTVRAVLAHGDARADYVEFHHIQDGRISSLKSGDMLGQARQPFFAPAFTVDLSPGEQEILIRLSNPVEVSTDFTLFKSEAFAEHAGRVYLGQGIFFGALLVLLFFYGAMLFSTKSPDVSAYLLYLLSVAVHFLSRSGLLHQYGPQEYPEALNTAVTPLAALIYAAGIRFARAFLETRTLPRLDLGLRVVQYACLLPVPVALFSRTLSRLMCDWIAMGVGPGVLLLVIVFLRVLPQAKFFLIGWILPIIAALLENLGFYSSSWRSDAVLQTSILAEFAFFAALISRRINRLEHDRAAQQSRLESVAEDIEQARYVHSALLPAALPDLPGLQVHVVYRPMSEIGGDFYDWVSLPDGRLAVLLADVTGHGLSAALDASAVRVAFQSAVRQAAEAREVLALMNRALALKSIDRFVSAVCAILDPRLQELDVSLAGHPPVLILRSNAVLPAGKEAPLLGCFEDAQFQSDLVKIKPGDLAAFYTDGVYEVPQLDDMPELEPVLIACGGLPPGRMEEAVVAHFDRMRGKDPSDDITFLTLRFT